MLKVIARTGIILTLFTLCNSWKMIGHLFSSTCVLEHLMNLHHITLLIHCRWIIPVAHTQWIQTIFFHYNYRVFHPISI